MSNIKNNIQYIEDTSTSSLLKIESLNKTKDFIVTATIYCPKKNPIMHKAIYDNISIGDNDIYFHFIKCDKNTKVATLDRYVKVIGILRGPPTNVSVTSGWNMNCNSAVAIVSEANKIARNMLEKNIFKDNFSL